MLAIERELPTQELPHLRFRRYLPHPLLQPWVEYYWSIQQPSPDSFFQEFLYPDGGSSLNFHLKAASSEGVFSCHQALRTLELVGELDNVGVRFLPAGAFVLLGLPIGELEGKCYEASELQLDLGPLHEQLAGAKAADRPAILDAWLLQRMNTLSVGKPLMSSLWRQLAKKENTLEPLGGARRKLERLFRQQIGLSPHQFRILRRVKHARTLIKTKPHLSLTEVAQHCGYYDQAHFIRQFRTITQCTPGLYRRRQNQRLARGELRPPQ